MKIPTGSGSLPVGILESQRESYGNDPPWKVPSLTISDNSGELFHGGNGASPYDLIVLNRKQLVATAGIIVNFSLGISSEFSHGMCQFTMKFYTIHFA